MAVLEKWLEDMQIVNSTQLMLFPYTAGNLFSQKKSFVGVPFPKGAISALYTKLYRLQDALREVSPSFTFICSNFSFL
jgi:hypothetical protein